MNPTSNAGSMDYTARISTDQLRKDARSVDSITAGAAKSMGDNLEAGESKVSQLMGGIVGKVKAAAIGAAAALTAAGTAATTFGLKSAADFEQTRIGIENMLGSADKARALLGDISKFAAQTPFEFPELAQATKQLIAFGFSGEDAFNTMKQLGDVSAAVGAPINDLAYLMGTLRTQGRAFTVDIRQFAQRGIPIYEYLAKVLKTNEKAISGMIEEGKIGFPEVQKAFAAMTAEGGKFYKTMDKQSASLSGQFSTLKDNLGQTLRELVGISTTGDVIQGSLFDKVRQGVASLNADLPRMSQNFQNSIMAMMPQLKQWASVVAQTASDIGEYLSPKFVALGNTLLNTVLPAITKLVVAFGPTVGAGLVWAIGATADVINALMVFMTPMINFMADNTWVVWGLVGAFVAFRTALAIQAAVQAVQVSLGLLNAAMIATAAQGVTTTSVFTGLRIAAMALAGPWQITLIVLGTAAVIASFESIKSMIEKVSQGIDDLNKKQVKVQGTDLNVSGGSGLGLVQQLRNAFSFRADGGPVSAGKPYIVGERQPEVFVPGRSGTILPEVPGGSGTGGITINLNPSGIMASSRSDLRAVAKDLAKALGEELNAKGYSGNARMA